MHQCIKLNVFFIILIISIYGKTIENFYEILNDDPNDDPVDVSSSTPIIKQNKISLASISCVESRRCGCYKGYCWAYIDEYQTPTTGWWCFTQQEGIRGKQQLWTKCTNSSQCSWTMTCGDCYSYVGKRTGIKTDKILC
jgi:hypothetical protein